MGHVVMKNRNGLAVDGKVIRATERLTGAHRDSIMRLGVRIGEGCFELHDRMMVNIATSGDVAFAHMLHLDSGTRQPGVPEGEVWIRSTVCCQRSDGKWSITHEHISLAIGWLKEDAWHSDPTRLRTHLSDE